MDFDIKSPGDFAEYHKLSKIIQNTYSSFTSGSQLYIKHLI